MKIIMPVYEKGIIINSDEMFDNNQSQIMPNLHGKGNPIDKNIG